MGESGSGDYFEQLEICSNPIQYCLSFKCSNTYINSYKAQSNMMMDTKNLDYS